MSKLEGGHILRGCPRCRVPMGVAILQRPMIYCLACGLTFEAELFQPPEIVVQPAAPAAAAASASCARHARNAAVAACETCGAFMCTLCRTASAGKVVCAACFERERSAQPASFTSWPMVAWYSAVGAIFFWPLSIVLGPIAIFAGIRSMTERRKDGEGSVAGPLLAMLAGLAGIAVGLFFLYSIARAFTHPRH